MKNFSTSRQEANPGEQVFSEVCLQEIGKIVAAARGRRSTRKLCQEIKKYWEERGEDAKISHTVLIYLEKGFGTGRKGAGFLNINYLEEILPFIPGDEQKNRLKIHKILEKGRQKKVLAVVSASTCSRPNLIPSVVAWIIKKRGREALEYHIKQENLRLDLDKLLHSLPTDDELRELGLLLIDEKGDYCYSYQEMLSLRGDAISTIYPAENRSA